jgi:hypothetical protein
VKRAAVVDGDDVESKGDDPYSVENFMAALHEEQAANAEFFGDHEGVRAVRVVPVATMRPYAGLSVRVTVRGRATSTTSTSTRRCTTCTRMTRP